jgi:hypothetical protein
VYVKGQVFREFIKPFHSYRFELSQSLPGKHAVLVYKTTISSQMRLGSRLIFRPSLLIVFLSFKINIPSMYHRAYLDADGAPRLTFRLFCQALARVAFILFPTMNPTSAFQHFVHVILLGIQPVHSQGERQSSSHSSPAGALTSSMDTKESKATEIVSDGCEKKLMLLSNMGCLDRRPIDNTFVHHSEQEGISSTVKGMKKKKMWNHLDSLSEIHHKEACISLILLSPE